MTLQSIPGTGLWIPDPPPISGPPALNSGALTIDATGEKVALCGQVWFKERTGTKDITRIGFRFHSVVKAGGSGLTVSLQDLAPTGPIQPDGVQDETVAVPSAGVTAQSWYRTDPLSANRTVSFAEELAIVIEYDGAGRLGTDSFTIACLTGSGGTDIFGRPASMLLTADWVQQNVWPNVILEFSDGTFGTLMGALPVSDAGALGFKVDTDPDEYALELQLPFPCQTDGAWIMFRTDNNGDFDIVLYDGTTPMTGGTVSIDEDKVGATGTTRFLLVPWTQPISLDANHTYRLAMKPTATTNVAAYFFEVADANHFQAHAGGTSWALTSRVDGGGWAAPTPTRRLIAGLRIGAIDDGIVLPRTRPLRKVS